MASELYHHGVKGMKWGVRKADYNSVNRHTNVYSKISDLELQEGAARMENRRNYKAQKNKIKSDLKAQKKDNKITKAEYRAKKRDGVNAARKVLNENNAKIRSNFNKAYYDTISAGEIASARTMNNLGSLMGADSYYTNSNTARLDKAAARRDEFMKEYTMRNYKG